MCSVVTWSNRKCANMISFGQEKSGESLYVFSSLHCVCVPELCDCAFLYRLFHLFSCSPSDLTLTTETVTGLGVLTSCQSRTASKSISRWTCVRCTSSRSWAPKVGTPTAWVMSLPSDTGSSTAATAAAGWAGMTEREGRWACKDLKMCSSDSNKVYTWY